MLLTAAAIDQFSANLLPGFREGWMRRREFIADLGLAAWPMVARGQQLERTRRIGVLMNNAADDPEGQLRVTAFAQGLQEAGWTVGRNVRIEYRWAGGNADRIRSYAAELVGLAPDVILTTGSFGLGPLQQATRSVPIVFVAVVDPGFPFTAHYV